MQPEIEMAILARFAAAVAALMLLLATLVASPAFAADPVNATGEPALVAQAAPRANNLPPADPAAPSAPSTTSGDEPQPHITYKTPYEFWLTGLTIGLGFIFVGLFCWLSTRKLADETVMQYFVLLCVIFASLFLIVAGYTEKQTAPVFGLLGSIIGYIFGKATSAPPPAEGAHAAQAAADPANAARPQVHGAER